MAIIYDLNDCQLSFKNGAYGGAAGSKDGIIIDGDMWMVKYPKNLSDMTGKGIASYSTSPLSEFIGSHIYDILGYDVHDTILGVRNSKLVVACRDFATNGILLEIRTIKNHTGKELSALLDDTPMSSTDTHTVDLDELLLHIRKNPLLSKISGIEERFFEQALIDIFIGNNDRNNGNWGILRENGKADRLAPIFDNGGCFLSKAKEEKISSLLNSAELKNNAVNTLTAYGSKGHHYSAIKFLERTKNEPVMQHALLKVIPVIRQHMDEIVNFIYEIPEAVPFGQSMIPVCSPDRKELYIRHMDIRYQELLYPSYEKVKEHIQALRQDKTYDEIELD